MSSLDNKVQTLADKIYADGVEKAKAEAQKILAEAKQQKEQLLSEAKAEAEQIVKQAKREAEKTYESSNAEISMASLRAIDNLEAKICNIVNDKAIDRAINKVVPTEDDVYNIIKEMAKASAVNGGTVVSTEDAEALKSYFSREAKEILESGVEIKEVKGLHSSFQLKPQNGSYKILMGKEELKAYFKEFFRPKLRELLFKDQTT